MADDNNQKILEELVVIRWAVVALAFMFGGFLLVLAYLVLNS
jgi:hypothetical protein